METLPPPVNSRTSEGQSFVKRFLHWLDILDPILLLSTEEEIKNAQLLLHEDSSPDPARDTKVKQAWRLGLASLHPDTGAAIHPLFRPPAFLPVGAPLVVAALLPHQGVKPAFFWQLLFQAYSAGFNLANGNATNQVGQFRTKQGVLLLSAVSCTALLGAAPQLIMKRYCRDLPAMQVFFRKFVPIPLMAFLGAYNVAVTRLIDFENGIEVVDKNGNVVGVSKKAGAKAVKETAVSRSLLLGTTALVPIVLLHFLESTRFILRNPLAFAPIRHISTAVAFGLMIPVSFSLFPQIGKIQRENLEPSIVSSTKEQELYYSRGL